MTLQPTEVVQRVLDARRRVREWPPPMWLEVVGLAPECVQDLQTETWTTTVETFRNPGEPILDAAKRLALYLDLQAEVYGRPPRLTSIQDRINRAHANLTTIQENR